MNKLNLILFFVLIANNCFTQNNTINVDFTSKDWKTFGTAKVQDFDSRSATCVSEGVGIAYLDSIEFQNGIIECDLFSPVDKAYLGIVFRMSSLNNFEYIYFQPHTSGKWDAVQYDPIFNRSATWQLFNGEPFQAVANIPTRKWFHAKIQVIGDSAKVFLDNNPNQVMSVKLKHETKSGSIGVCSYHPGNFANLKVTSIDTIITTKKLRIDEYKADTYISSWLITEPYDNYTFKYVKPFLNDSLIKDWTKVYAEENNVVNLNRYFTHSKENNTILAKVIIESNKTQQKDLYFGFSDKIKIYLNSENLFTGDNSFIESDKYEDRGYVLDKHQKIELPLLKGENELILEIAEKKFGWGFIAQLDNLNDINIIAKRKTK